MSLPRRNALRNDFTSDILPKVYDGTIQSKARIENNQMRLRLILITAMLTAWLAGPVKAHPGHGMTDNPYGILHYLTSPTHLIVAVTVAAAATGAVWLARKILFGDEASMAS